ncbi:hypothetical protein [uncultured Methanomethylovorans sp.]|uniref:hypothetical protein n=1 Tax=uncultured Methanomethylovorans sp. TaxID=183759 RepID=UPI002AA93CC3|nr:hypothetical protein [uncultured Methanomethylovorans sp.]
MPNIPIPTTIRIDPTKKELFEKLSHLHHKTISDICREGVDKELEKYLPAYCLHEKAAVLKAELLAIEEAARCAERVDQDSLKNESSTSTPVVDSIFLEQRESKLQDKSLISMMNRGIEPSWDRFYFKCGFQSPTEAKNWFWSEAMKRGLVK